MRTLNLSQGSNEWHAERSRRFTASEAPAMMGASKYQNRDELLYQKATGIGREATDAEQALFDRGHRAEAAARRIVEDMLGQDLYPVTAVHQDDDRLLASLDGATLDESIIYEHKLWSESLAAQVRAGDLEPHYYWQLEQQLLVTGAEKVIFVCSDGTPEKFASMEYRPVPGRADALRAGWDQFAADLAAYTPAERAAPVTAAPMDSLPAVVVQVQGALTVAGNLPAFGDALRAFIERIPVKPSTDQEFADTEAACKALKRAEEALEAAENNALAQLADVDTLRRLVADYRALARTTRLQREKLVALRKDQLREEIVREGRAAYDAHLRALNDRLGTALLATSYRNVPDPDFGGAIKGLRTVDSIRNAVNTELARAKIAASAIADRVQANLALLRERQELAFLFPDVRALATKETDDLRAVMTARIAEHEAKERARLDAERQRIRAEEQHKAQMEAAAKMKSEQEAERQANEDRRRIEAHAAQQQSEAALDAVAARARLDADPHFAAVVAGADEAPTLNLSAINDRLRPISISAAGLVDLGIEPAGRERRAVLYRESQFAEICGAIARRAADAMREALEAVA